MPDQSRGYTTGDGAGVQGGTSLCWYTYQHRQNEDAAVQATGGDQAAIGLHGDARQRAPVQLGGHQQVRPLEPAAPQLHSPHPTPLSKLAHWVPHTTLIEG